MLFTVDPSFFVSTPAAFSAVTAVFCIFFAAAVILFQFLYTKTAAIAIPVKIKTIFPPGVIKEAKLSAPWTVFIILPTFQYSAPTPCVSFAIITIAGPTAATINATFTINFCVSGDNFENLSVNSLSLFAAFVAGCTTTCNTALPNTVNEFFTTLIVFRSLLIDVCISCKAFSVDP